MVPLLFNSFLCRLRIFKSYQELTRIVQATKDKENDQNSQGLMLGHMELKKISIRLHTPGLTTLLFQSGYIVQDPRKKRNSKFMVITDGVAWKQTNSERDKSDVTET
jgi:hypothetical protein